jgi:polygalacturonase
MTNRLLAFCLLFTLCLGLQAKPTKDLWPDGTPFDAWFSDTATVDVSTLGRRFVVTDYGVSRDSNLVQTKALQAVIDRCASEGGGVVVIPAGTFLSGSLYFKQGTHLLVEAGGKLKGSDRVEDFDIRETRIEGQTCKYYTALVNVDGVNGMVISGPGTIDGNGYHYWRQFWLRREWNRECTNKDEQRPRLVYISNSSNITVQNVRTVNSPFWTNHLYRSHHVRYLNCYIYSSTEDVKGPSTDAIDIDVCHDILVNGCYMNVNDDAIAIKGGKGTWADQDPNNGPNKNIIIQNCRYGVVHGCLTLGSESVYDRNIILRNIQADKVNRVLWLKMRPDTPQHYEYVRVENITGNTGSFLVVRPWTQFFNLEKRDDMPLSQCNNIQIKGIRMNCRNFFDVGTSDKYALKDFSFEDIDVKDEKNAFRADVIAGTVVKNLTINGTKLPNQK